jgi:hypothetical protein
MTDAEDRARRARLGLSHDVDIGKQELADLVRDTVTKALNISNTNDTARSIADDAATKAAEQVIEKQEAKAKEAETAKPQPEEHYHPHDLLTPIKSVAQEKEEKRERDEKAARAAGSFKEGK